MRWSSPEILTGPSGTFTNQVDHSSNLSCPLRAGALCARAAPPLQDCETHDCTDSTRTQPWPWPQGAGLLTAASLRQHNTQPSLAEQQGPAQPSHLVAAVVDAQCARVGDGEVAQPRHALLRQRHAVELRVAPAQVVLAALLAAALQGRRVLRIIKVTWVLAREGMGVEQGLEVEQGMGLEVGDGIRAGAVSRGRECKLSREGGYGN